MRRASGRRVAGVGLLSDASLISAVVIAIVAFVYLTIIRPARQEQERHRQQMRDLRPGDRVVTTSNFVATVKQIEIGEDGQTRLTLELGEGIVVSALPGAVLRRLGPEHETAPKTAQGGGDRTPSAGSGRPST